MSEKTLDERIEDLKDRVLQFHSLTLPGQPMGMHMGTSYLVSDLLKMVEELAAPLTEELEA
jgi:hypothetical protein